MFRPILLFLLLLVRPIRCRNRHVVNFRWADLYPESFAWDPRSDHFVVGSMRRPRLISVSDAGVASELLLDDSLPANCSFLGISVDPRLHRVLAVVHRESPPYSALAAYQLPSYRRLFLAPLDGLLPSSAVAANDVVADFSGNAYVTDSANDVVFKVTEQGEASILSRSQTLKAQPSDAEAAEPHGLNGIIYNSKGYLLVTQSNTGRLFKVNADDGAARRVILNRDLTVPDGIAVRRRDGVVLVVSPHRMYFIRSDDSWSEGVVFDETALEEDRQASSVVVGADNRVYALYGYASEGRVGTYKREEFSIVEVESEEETKGDVLWIYLLIGLGFAYFLAWRFQMRKLVNNMDKKLA